VLDSDSICTDGLRFNDRLIRGCLAFVGKREPWTYLRGPKLGGAVAGKDLVFRNASLQQRGHRRVTWLRRERGPQQMLDTDRVVAYRSRHVSGSQHERSRSISETFEHGSPVHEALQRSKPSMAADGPSTRGERPRDRYRSADLAPRRSALTIRPAAAARGRHSRQALD
jgi:hypothetical protein